jgi:hypothetical protein
MRPWPCAQRCSVYVRALVDASAAGGAIVIWLPNFISQHHQRGPGGPESRGKALGT